MDQVKRRQIKQILGWVAIAAVIGLLAAVPLMARSGSAPEASGVVVKSGTVQRGTIETVLRGGGTLAAQEAVAITLPEGIKLERYLVRNGDTVSAGDPVAEVDPVSILNAIAQVQEKLDALKQNMADGSGQASTVELKAQAGGRVKAVYAKPGDDVRDVMLAHGALAVLSLDGRMAVTLKCDVRLPVGEKVMVAFANGREVEGRVETGLDGTVVISVADEGYAIGEWVTVSAADQVLGTGALYVHNAWKAVAWSGVIGEALVEPEDLLDAGDALFEVADEETAAKFADAVKDHGEYRQILQELFRLYECGVLTSNCDGMISGIDEKSSLLLENDITLVDFSQEDVTVLTVVPQNIATLTITLDERDIGKVSLGQTAQVRVDALKNQTYEAVVTAIGTKGTNKGGSSKYTVELTMDRDRNMLPGMHASADIIWNITAEVLTVPVAALCEQGGRTVVYTGYDGEEGGLKDPVTVTTGVSDGITVEILTGLSSGDVFYYPYYEAK